MKYYNFGFKPHIVRLIERGLSNDIVFVFELEKYNSPFVDYNEWYRWYEGVLPESNWNYGAIVDAIISTYYPQDKMQAIINNYLLDPNNEDSLNEFNAMQEKRAWAKQTAKELMAYAEENGIIEHFDEK